MDIISMKVLNSIRLKERENELYRIIKSILKSEGFIERIYGPQLPSINSLYPNYTRDLYNITGVGFDTANSTVTRDTECIEDTIDTTDTTDTTVDGVNNKLYWICEIREEINRPKTKIMTLDKKYHVWDREEDLMDIKNYYKEFYKFIVKPLQNINSENDLLNKYTKSLQFIKYSNTVSPVTVTGPPNSTNSSEGTTTKGTTNTTNNTNSTTKGVDVNGIGIEDNVVNIDEKKIYKNKIRIIKIYEFNKELLNKFNIKFKSNKFNESNKSMESNNSTNSLKSVESLEDMEIKLPNEIYKNLFGN
ncbi:uncharacterized protein TA18361 [Theileria annulata]|uniref:Uncharacterized protein n=1 Tax=Theileria annulata TaxID=5874 RepID=Q4UAY3_THEAN|nr:uncharacterized protein TA18361 [Theileria annulata]CAI76018.1 hypothetical protein TA18361 [Theileria annulata]|eukprot:XP_955494.1 hypothetical protein TA18361 [Theileria annulata]